MNDTPALLEVIDIHIDYDGKPLLKGVSFELWDGETLCLLGESGSGKSTLLRIIAGLEAPAKGSVQWRGEDIRALPVHERGFGLMFQDYALFPHLTVFDNVAFGLRTQRLDENEVRARVMTALEQVHMTGFAQRGVQELSGGEQQRVALARTIAPRPGLIMLDEPLGALDRALKGELLGELRALLHASGTPAIYVTHDQEEAFSLADRLLLLHHGRIIQGGEPEAVYQRPLNAWVARFLGQTNLVSGTVLSNAPLIIRTELGDLRSTQPPCGGVSVGDTIVVLLRSAAFEPERDLGVNHMVGKVEDVVFQGNDYLVILRSGADTRLAFHTQTARAIGESVSFHIPADDVLCLAQADGSGS